MDSKFVVGLCLLITGLILVSTTVYQERIGPPEDEDYHMKIPSTGTYVWGTRNLVLTIVGVFFIIIGSVSIALSIIEMETEDEDKWMKH